MKLDRVDSRAKLALRRDPHWQRLAKGRHLGFRMMTKGSPGTWLARAFLDTRPPAPGQTALRGPGYVYEDLGDFATLPEKERYDAAKRAAEVWFQHLDLGGSSAPGTVREACEAYREHLKAERSERAAHDAHGHFCRLVYGDAKRGVDPDPIANVELSKLTQAHMDGFRSRVLKRVPDRSTFNRAITPVRAALNRAHEVGKVASSLAWRSALRPFNGEALEEQKEDRRRLGYLDIDERRELVQAASDEARPLFKSWALLPFRPGDVAALKVKRFDPREKALRLPKGKTGSRVIPLTAEALAHFKECAKGKLPEAWLVSRADGSQWKKEAWRDEVKAAAAKAKLPQSTVAYTIRHSLITDLVQGGVDIFTVAKLSGTSVKMIEQHYGHLQQDHARSALEKLALAMSR